MLLTGVVLSLMLVGPPFEPIEQTHEFATLTREKAVRLAGALPRQAGLQ
jgi:hypothetical protein